MYLTLPNLIESVVLTEPFAPTHENSLWPFIIYTLGKWFPTLHPISTWASIIGDQDTWSKSFYKILIGPGIPLLSSLARHSTEKQCVHIIHLIWDRQGILYISQCRQKTESNSGCVHICVSSSVCVWSLINMRKCKSFLRERVQIKPNNVKILNGKHCYPREDKFVTSVEMRQLGRACVPSKGMTFSFFICIVPGRSLLSEHE